MAIKMPMTFRPKGVMVDKDGKNQPLANNRPMMSKWSQRVSVGLTALGAVSDIIEWQPP